MPPRRWSALGVAGLLLLASASASQAITFSSGTLAPGVSRGTVESAAPTLTNPVLGVATATSVNNVAITAPASAATLTLGSGKTATISNTLTFTGTDASTVALGTGGTVAYTANKLSAFAATTSAELAGVLSNETGSGLVVYNNAPALTGLPSVVNSAADATTDVQFLELHRISVGQSTTPRSNWFLFSDEPGSTYTAAIVGTRLNSLANWATTLGFYTNGSASQASTLGALTLQLLIGSDGLITVSKQLAVTPATTETIAAAATITADTCGGIKRVTAAGAVTTNTTDTFTAPATAPNGCVMDLCNVGVTNAITLDKNAHFFSLAGGDVILLANTCTRIGNDGTQWRQLTALFTAS